MRQKGFAPIVILILIVLGITGYFTYKTYHRQIVDSFNSFSPTPIAIVISDLTLNWKTYTNTKYNYLLKYPEVYTAGLDGPSTDTPESAAYLVVNIISQNALDNSRFAVSSFNKSEENTLEKLANENYQKVSTYKFSSLFNLYSTMDNEVIKPITPGILLGNNMFTYTIKGNYVNDKASEYLTPIENHMYIWIEHNNNILLISLRDDVTMNQILSTFKFVR